jgi:hypothetical protein
MASMSVTEEVHEHAEHASSSFDKRVAATMAAVAAALAVVTVMGHISTTDELLKQQKASDQWSYYQAKSIRRYTSDVARDFLAALSKTEGAEKYAKNIEKYQREGEEIKVEAEKLEAESKVFGNHALRLHFGGIFLELAIVFCSLAILTKRSFIWYGALLLAGVGAVIAAPDVTSVLQEMLHH